jgi:uncharacterized tellurite resistance protein B-like protein
MDLKILNESQRSALLELLVLGMYADAKLTDVEDAKIRAILGQMGAKSESESNRLFDAAVNCVRRSVTSSDSARAYATSLAQAFAGSDQRRQVLDLVTSVLESDRRITVAESEFATIVQEALRL